MDVLADDGPSLAHPLTLKVGQVEAGKLFDELLGVIQTEIEGNDGVNVAEGDADVCPDLGKLLKRQNERQLEFPCFS